MATSKRFLQVLILLLAIPLILLIPQVRQTLLSRSGNGAAAAPAEEGEEEPAASSTTALPVGGVVVRRQPFVLTIRGTGRAEAVRRVLLAPRIGGRITVVNVTEGKAVRAGATLVEIDREPLVIALREAESELAAAQADLNVKLRFDGASDSSRHEVLAQRTGVTPAREKIARVRLDLEATTLTAPFAGAVTDLSAEAGGVAVASQPLLALVNLSTIRIRAEVLENDFGQLAVGASAAVTFPALPGESFEGRVDALGPEIDPARGTGEVFVTLANPESRIRPGMYADLTISGTAFADRIAVPRPAVIERDRKLLVFRASNGRAEWQYVETGLETDRLVEITSGVADGDTILVDGHLTLAHAAPVRVSLAGD